MFRQDLKDCCTCVPPRSEISLNIWMLDCCTARKPMRVKISCSMVYSKPPNSIWIKSYAVSTDGPFLTDCLTELSRTVRNWRQRVYCKSGIEIGHDMYVQYVELNLKFWNISYVTDVGSPYCSSVVNGRKKTKYGMKQISSLKIQVLYRLLQYIPVNYRQFTTAAQNGRGSD